jgi:glycosyltransferase involved in cell wall biosynthesis
MQRLPGGVIDRLPISYTPQGVSKAGSVLGAMCDAAGVPTGDFRLPVKAEWLADADALLITSRYEGGPAVAVEALAQPHPRRRLVAGRPPQRRAL